MGCIAMRCSSWGFSELLGRKGMIDNSARSRPGLSNVLRARRVRGTCLWALLPIGLGVGVEKGSWQVLPWQRKRESTRKVTGARTVHNRRAIGSQSTCCDLKFELTQERVGRNLTPFYFLSLCNPLWVFHLSPHSFHMSSPILWFCFFNTVSILFFGYAPTKWNWNVTTCPIGGVLCNMTIL